MDDLAYTRWSFHVVDLAQYVDASKASVRMYRKGNRQPTQLRLLHRRSNNWYLGGLVWAPQVVKPKKGNSDISYHVQIQNLRVRGEARTYTYEVTLVDAEAAREQANVTLSEVDIPLEERKNLRID